MGFGFPAAIGAQLGRPDELVVAIAGDGGFQMAAAYGIAGFHLRRTADIDKFCGR